MPISFPSSSEIIARIRADVSSELPDVDPTLENSLLDTILVAFGSRVSDFYLDISRLLSELFPQAASTDFLDFFGEIFGVSRTPASKSSGDVVFNGTIGTSVLSGTEFTSSNAQIYTSTQSASVVKITLNVLSLTRLGQTVTVSFASNHNLATGLQVEISGANETEYNGTFTITVLNATQIQYEVEGSPSTPATGTIELSCDIITIPIESQDFGSVTNLNSGALLNLLSSISGITEPGYVDFNGVLGGADVEGDDSYRERIILERSSLEALFNSVQIEQKAKEVAGVTRVFVEEITPSAGQVTILFVRDDDADGPIPTPEEVEEVKNKILEIKPAHTADDDVIVTAPTPINSNFTFTALSPDTPELREAIENNLNAFFKEQVDFQETLEEGEYNSVIFTTIDPITGIKVESFTLSSPVGDIIVGTDEIAILGNVSFAI